jgi:hypothetical protein
VLSELLAYYVGKSVGRHEGLRRRRDLTALDIKVMRTVVALIVFLAMVVLLVSLT